MLHVPDRIRRKTKEDSIIRVPHPRLQKLNLFVGQKVRARVVAAVARQSASELRAQTRLCLWGGEDVCRELRAPFEHLVVK